MKSFKTAEKKPFFQKLLLIMKLMVVMVFICSLQASADGFGQQKISLKLKKTQITDVLVSIEKQTNYRFLYNNDLLDLKQKVSLNVQDAELKQVLDRLFAETDLSYELMQNNLIVIKETADGTNEVKAVIKGKITGENNAPLSGVSVMVKGTNRGTTTDAQGNYSITVESTDVLVISYVGYESQEIAVADKVEINVVLKGQNQTLTDVVVIGYGTASKRDLTGSISTIKGKEIGDKPNTNPLASVQGKVAGVSVVNTGELGKEPDLRIRGTISRSQTKPLYVVDGLFNDNIDFLNPSEIESVEILKDPSSLAIFGVRGANGVIIVTTKKARTGQFAVNLASTVGFKSIVDKIKLTNASQFKTLYDEQRVNQGGEPYDKYNLYTGNTDWIDQISQNGLFTNNNINISGGTEKNKFYMGIGYIKEDGLIKHESLQKYLLTINDELKVSKALKFGFNFNGYRSQLPQTQARDFGSAVTATPIVEPFNTEKGVYNRLPSDIGGPQITNPLMVVEQLQGTNLQYDYRMVGSIFGELNFLKYFNFKTTFYGDLGFGEARRYTPILNTYDAELNTVSSTSGYNITKVYQSETTIKKYQQEYLLTFKNQFGSHGLTMLAGFTTNFNSYSETNGEVRQSASGNPIPSDKRFWYLDNFFGDPTTKITAISPGNDIFGNRQPLQWEQATVSYLVRALYNYKGKYLLNASFRRDGSSDISPDNRYQNFVAVGAAWEISKENFMADQNIFDFLKLKASWGVLGNQYTQIHYPFYPLLTSGQSAVFGNNVVPGFVPSFIADPLLKWETVDSKEVGIEFRTFKNRLNVEANYFNKLTDNLLTNYPGLNGQKPGITNAGKIANRGIEIAASWSDKFSEDFSYSISGNITTLHNEVKELYQDGFEIIDGSSRTTAGYPIGYFYGYVQEGIYQSDDDKANSPDASSLGTYGAGDIKFKDINGDGVINTDDRTIIGNPTPDFVYGFSLGLNYKGLDLGIDFQGTSGNQIFRNWGNGASYAVFNYREARLGRWNGAGSSDFEPVLNDNNAINRLPSTYMIESGSYLRIRNVQLGYNFSPASLKKLHIKAFRLFVNGQNLKTFKNNSGFTPEFGGSAISFGVDNGSYPLPAIYTVGVNVTF